jgi:hypothetical protein
VKTGKKYLVSPGTARIAEKRRVNQLAAALKLTANKEA